MKKSFSARYPERGQEQLDLTKAIVRLLNCRRFIYSQGFQEVEGNNSGITGIAGDYAKIFFPDGSSVSDANFKNTSNRDRLLENMVIKGVVLRPNGWGYDNDERSRVITSNYKRDGYGANLAIKDTTKKELGFFRRAFHDAELFALVYTLTLNKDLISDSDIEQFTKYQQGLDDAMRRETLLAYSQQVPHEVEMPQAEIHFINPWEVQIPKLGGKKNE